MLVAVLKFAAFIGISALISCVYAHAEEHKIKHLPYLNFKDTINFNQYAGRIHLDTGERMFYWYAEAENDPDNAPIVLWLNGGPGCSSLGGFFTENGPFVVVGDKDVRRNRYNWNRHVNMVWLESPAGVGFSQPFRPQGYNDTYTTSRSYEFIILFFEKYPSLIDRKFYITGESYGGIYIPALTSLLIQKPIKGVNIQGFAVGNPYTDSVIDSGAYLEYYYTHGLISLEKYTDVRNICKERLTCFFFNDDCTEECKAAIDGAMEESEEEKFNRYYIYGDTCQIKNKQGGLLKASRKNKLKKRKVLRRGKFSPCVDQFTQQYLRLHEVQRAIHASDGDSYSLWTDCNQAISQLYKASMSALPMYRSFLDKGLKILVYSGDADSVVNFIGTERWIVDGLKLKVKSEWKAWFGPDDQLAGYNQEYEGLTFMTIKGAGHMVPATKPLHGLRMFECFIFDDCEKFEYPTDPFEEIASGRDFDEAVKESYLFTKITVNASFALLIVAFLAAWPTVFIVAKRFLTRRHGYETITD